MHFFSFGIDPLLGYLEKRLQGILICSLPVLGPVLPDQPPLHGAEAHARAPFWSRDWTPVHVCSGGVEPTRPCRDMEVAPRQEDCPGAPSPLS